MCSGGGICDTSNLTTSSIGKLSPSPRLSFVSSIATDSRKRECSDFIRNSRAKEKKNQRTQLKKKHTHTHIGTRQSRQL